MRKAKRTSKKMRLLLSLVLVAFAALLFVKMVQLYMQIDLQQGQLDSLKQQIEIVGIQNEDLGVQLENMQTPEGQTQQLRDNGYVGNDDQVYIYASN